MFNWFSFIILLFSLSIDTFIASVSISLSKIKVPFTSIFIICLINTLMLASSYLLGEKIYYLLPNYLIILLSSLPFLFLGFYKIFDAKPIPKKEKNHSFIQAIFYIFKSPEDAHAVDLDFSKTLSIKELVLLSISLSLDNLVAGFGLGMQSNSFSLVFIFNFLINFILFLIGNRLFLRITNYPINWSLISGLIFTCVGIYRIFS